MQRRIAEKSSATSGALTVFVQRRLNEGFTMFLERKIIGRMFGDDTRQFEALGGVEDLLYAVRDPFNTKCF